MRRLPLVVPFAGVVLVGAASCNQISTAPKGSPRVELEVAVRVEDAYASRLQGLDEDFLRELRERVLAKSDVGLRFYPVPTERYEGAGARPSYLMSVDVRSLTYDIGSRTVNRPNTDPVVETWVSRVGATVAANMVKRRSAGPELTVANAQQTATVGVSQTGTEGKVVYQLQRDQGQLPLQVARDDLLRSIVDALDRALREMLPAIDRELTAGTAPAPSSQSTQSPP
jgi:hypothetical protein